MASQYIQFPKSTSFENLSDMPINTQHVDEAEIWIKFKNGDEAAFIWIYRNYFDILYNFARQFDLDADSVKDQIQELFIYIRNNRTRLADVKSIKYYLFVSLRRRLLANKKRQFSFLSRFISDNKNKFEVEIVESPEVKLINQSIDKEIKGMLSKSMSKLTLRQKEAVLYFYYEGMSYKEIADIMDLKKVKSARKLIYRAIDALRKDLQLPKSTLH